MARKFKIIEVVKIPPCDFCTSSGCRPVKPGLYDIPTIMGPWANACHTHMLQYCPENSQIGYKKVLKRDQILSDNG